MTITAFINDLNILNAEILMSILHQTQQEIHQEVNMIFY